MENSEKVKQMNEQERETKIRLRFEMWLRQKDLGIDEIFAEDVVYIESWAPQYEGRGCREAPV